MVAVPTENIKPCPDNQASNNQPAKKDDHGDILIRGFWACGKECTIDVGVADMDASSYKAQDLASILKAQEKEKKRKYLTACLEQCHHFTLVLVSTN